MNLKHVEELAKDKDLQLANIVGCFMNFDKEYDLERFGYSADAKEEVKNYDELTDEQKEELINQAQYYWLKDESHTDICCICDCVMAHQIEMFDDSLENYEFFEILHDNYD